MLSLLQRPFAFPMLVYQSIMLALVQIWANKIRGILTTLGILIGVAAVSSVIALIDGMRTCVLAEFESFGTNKLSIQPHWRQTDFKNGGRWKVVFKPTDFRELLEKCPSVASVTRDVGCGEPQVARRGSALAVSAWLRGVDPEWHDIERRGTTFGRPLTLMDSLQHRRVCLIDERLIDRLHLNRNPLGQIIETEFFGRFLIVGVLEGSLSLTAGDLDIGNVTVPFEQISYTLRNYPLWFDATAVAKSREVVEDAKAEIEFYMRQKRRLKPTDEANFAIETPTVAIEKLNQVASMLTTVAGGIVAVSLLVGGVGIMNIMLVSVSERTREIGLRKAVGARPGAILSQFLIEAVVLCMLGGALGLAAGQGITSAVSSFLPSDARQIMNYDPMGDAPDQEIKTGGLRIRLPMSAVKLALGFSVGVGILFGIFPAIKAASLDPIVSLRHE